MNYSYQSQDQSSFIGQVEQNVQQKMVNKGNKHAAHSPGQMSMSSIVKVRRERKSFSIYGDPQLGRRQSIDSGLQRVRFEESLQELVKGTLIEEQNDAEINSSSSYHSKKPKASASKKLINDKSSIRKRSINKKTSSATNMKTYKYVQEQHRNNTFKQMNSETLLRTPKLEKQYRKAYQSVEQTDTLIFKRVSGFPRLKYELQIYEDDLKFLKLRKYCVFVLYSFFICCKGISRSQLLKVIMLINMIVNIAFFVYKNTHSNYSLGTLNSYEKILMYIYIMDVSLKMIANGIYFHHDAFFKSLHNCFDLSLTILYIAYVQQYENIIDFSPIRLITLLLYMGGLVPGLQIMLNGLGKAFKYITEALLVVLLFTIFFALVGMSLFQGLANYRCINPDGTLPEKWIFCRAAQCPEELICAKQTDTPNIPTSFNNIFFAIAQILRVITMDDWTYVMYFTLKSFSTTVWVYYLLIIFFGGFFGFNLVIAVLKTFYSESVQDQTNQEAENQEFSVLQMKQDGQYEIIQQFKNYLKGNTLLINKHKFISQEFGQPRVLSGVKRFKQQEYNQLLLKFVINTDLKYLLLPKLRNLRLHQLKVDIDQLNYFQFNEQMINLFIHDEFTKYQPIPIQQINMSSSQFDILSEKHRIEQLMKNSQKNAVRQKLFFKINKPKKLSWKNRFRLPVNQRFRLRLPRIFASQDSQDHQQLSSPQKSRTFTFYGPWKKPAVVKPKKDNEIFVRIHGVYLNYKNVVEKINLKIPKKIPNIKDYSALYQEIKQQDSRLKILSYLNFSAINVLPYYSKSQELKRALNHRDPLIWLSGTLGFLLLVRKYVFLLINFTPWQIIVDFIILINFAGLVLTGIIEDYIIQILEDFSTICLILEGCFRLIGYSPTALLHNGEMLVDIIIVALNLIELTLSPYLQMADVTARLIRATKGLLFYRCLKYNTMAVIIGNIAKRTFKQYIYLTLLMFFAILIYGLMGSEVYSGMFDQSQDLGQLHSFDDPLKAWMTVFNIMTNDDWFGVLVLGSEINLVFAMIYSLSMVFFLNYLTYGLVMAILLDGFGLRLGQNKNYENDECVQKVVKQYQSDSEIENSPQLNKLFKTNSNIQLNNEKQSQNDNQNSLYSTLQKSISQIVTDRKIKTSRIFHGIACAESLFLFKKQNKFRIACCQLQRKTLFQSAVDFTIVISISIFALQTYYGRENYLLNYFLTLCNTIILVQKFIEIVALGFFLDEGAYLKYTWQLCDLAYLVSFYTKMAGFNWQILSFLIYLRYLRPFTLLYRISWVNKTYLALINSLFSMAQVFVTILMVWTMFAVFGMIIYQNQFGYCESKMSFEINKELCLSQNQTWVTYKHNFNNITSALPSLFVIATFDGWGEILQIAQNSQPEEIGPKPYANQTATYIFLITFCFVGSMFFFSLFTSLLFINLKKNQQQLQYNFLTENQTEFIKISHMILKEKVYFSYPPTSFFRNLASKILSQSITSYIAFFTILIDTLAQLTYYTEISVEFSQALNIIFQTITGLLFVWILLQLLSLGVYRYFEDTWRIYQFVIVILSFIDMGLDSQINLHFMYYKSTLYDENFQFTRILFAVRNLRMLLLFQGLKGIQRLVRIMGFVFPFLGKLLFILTIFTISSALLAQELFGHIDKGEVLDEQINFKTFTASLLTLFKCISCDNFRTIMTDTMIYNPYCSEDPIYCGSQFSQLFFITFVFISNYVLINLFVLGMIEQFEKFYQLKNLSIIQTYIERIDHIKTIWCKYSYEKQGKAMHYKNLCRFLMALGEPFVQKDENLWDCAKLSGYFKVKADEHGYIKFNQLLFEFFRRTFKPQIYEASSQEAKVYMKQFSKQIQLKLHFMRTDKKMRRNAITQYLDVDHNFSILNDYFSILIIFKSWQNHAKQILLMSIHEQQNFTERTSKSADNEIWDIFSQEDEEEQSLSKSSRRDKALSQSHKNASSTDSREYLDNLPFYKERWMNCSSPLVLVPVSEKDSDVSQLSSQDGRPNIIYRQSCD